jgi:glyoxylase-like metal-dependent hydrolase (beta-lactamase superfamily II)
MKKPLWVFAALAAALIFGQATAFGQSPAMEVVTGAAEALGGKDKILAVKTLIVEGSGIQPNIGQNPLPESALLNWNVPEFNRTIDFANARMRVEQHRVAQFDFALATDVHQTLGLDGNIAFNVNADGKAQRVGDAAAQERRIEMLGNPIAIVRAALDPSAKLSNLRKKGSEQMVDITTAQGDHVTLAVDGKTHLPASVSWMTSSENLGDVVNTTEFSSYETVGGLKLPKHYLTKIDFRNWVSADIQVSKNTVDGAAGDLAAPANVKSAAAPGPPVITVDAQAVGKGVWWLAGNGNAFSVLFEFDDHLTLFEVPTSQARSKAVIDKARATVPGKPLTEVIVSHHHFDHTGGLRTAVAEGLTVISHKGNEGIFKEVTSRKATLKPDLLAQSGKTLKFRGVDDTLVLKDKSMEVVIYHVIGNTHSPLLLMAYVPRDKILVQGDLIDIGWTQHPWAENYAKNLQMRNIEFAKDVPVHGKIATRAEELAALSAMKKAAMQKK